MIVVIDTSSFLSLVRYYLPFDKKEVLFNFIKNKIGKAEIIIIDKVLDECKYQSRGIIFNTLTYMSDKEFKKSSTLPVKTDTIIAPSPEKFLRQVDAQFVNSVMRNKLTNVEFEIQKNQFLEGADMKLIIFCLNLIKDKMDEEIILVSEESESSNDNKLFKKIPSICKELSINIMTLPQLLIKYEGIKFEFQ